jgi:Ti-type conjugative transfer relaxase TraA
MAIEYARCEIISVASDSSLSGMSAYMARDIRVNNITKTRYDFSHKAADLVHHEVLLPEGAPTRLRDPNILWQEATAAETTIDRRTKAVRFKRNAQGGKHIVLALAKDLDNDGRLESARRFVKKHFTRFGVAVELAIHSSDPDSPDNPHAHLLVSTRFVTEDGFGKKARILDPSFSTGPTGKRFVSEEDYLARRWAEEQNGYFAELGLDLRVDPTRRVGGMHLGPTWHAVDSAKRERAAEADTAAAQSMTDPTTILEGITVHKQKFTRRDLEKYVSKHGVKGQARDDAVKSALSHSDIVPLYDPAGKQLFTTKMVREHEWQIIKDFTRARPLGRIPDPTLVRGAAARHTLDPEQTNALQNLTSGQRPRILIGRAGAGKTRTLAAAREVYENSGYKTVLGIAPTNTAALLLKSEAGFSQAMTVHRALFLLEKGASWGPSTAIVLDESSQLDAVMYGRLLKAVADAGATLLLAGDDRQYNSVRRGGIFAELINRFGAAELKRVRRQDANWQREASEAFANGQIEEGLKAYSRRDFVHWASTLDETRARLIADWSARRGDLRPQFVYASTNLEVNRLNALAKMKRRERGELGPGISFLTNRGEVEASVGDRLQFYANDRRAGIFNGILGTITAVTKHRIEARTDAGETVEFDPQKFTQWGLGYSGTIYRGQGKTQINVFALFDNPHAWNARAAYVAMTRHKSEVHLYVSEDIAANESTLAQLMSRISDDRASIAHDVLTPQRLELENQKERIADLRKRMGLRHVPKPTGWATKIADKTPNGRNTPTQVVESNPRRSPR